MRFIANFLHLIKHLVLEPPLPLIIKLDEKRGIDVNLVQDIKHHNGEYQLVQSQCITGNHNAHHWHVKDQLKGSNQEKHILEPSW